MSLNAQLGIVLLLAAIALPTASAQKTEHRFSDKINLAMIGSYSAALAIDAHSTAQIVGSKRFYESNPIVRPFTHSTAGVVSYFALTEGCTIGGAFALHRLHHHKLERILLALAASYETAVDTYNATH